MNKRKIIIAGGTGFLGQYLQSYFQKLNYEVIILTRNPKKTNEIYWDAKTSGAWALELEGAFALINLTGRSVDCRYHKKNKAIILNSRIDSTRILGQAICECNNPPEFWLNSSTATIYENTPGHLPANTELDGKTGNDFSMTVGKEWEKEFFSYKTPDTLKTALRTAIVYGKNGGAFPVVSKLAKRGLCSKQSTGQQWISWVHILDFARAIEYILEQKMEGVVNICSPNFITNKGFNQLLKKMVKSKICIPQPKWLLELGAFIIRTQTELILKSRKVYPQKLLEAGFEFEFPSCDKAVTDLLKREKAI